MIKVSDYIFRFIERKGIKHIFMLPGGGAMHLVDSIGKSKVEYICCQHEQAAAIAGEAYGQHTNAPGVVLVTSGPGATNAITGVTAGWIDSTPMFILSGQAKRADLVGNKKVRQIGSQEVQIIDMVKPITKYAVQVLNPLEIRYHLERAYFEATDGRAGPVWLDLPVDVQAAMVDETSLKAFLPIKQEIRNIDTGVRRTIELLQESKKPLILAGNGIKLGDAVKEFYHLLNVLEIPVLTTWKAIDMIGEDNELYVGHPGIMGDRGANLILQTADLLISIGSRLDTSITAFNENNFGKNAKKIIIDIDENEIKRMNIPQTEICLSCNAKYYMEQIVNKITDFPLEKQKEDWKEWLLNCQDLRGKYPVVTDEHRRVKGVVSAYYFIEVLCNNLGKNDIIVPESSGGAGEITYQAFKLKYGQKMKNAAGLGSMGFGLPYAIGSCLANENNRTVLINGDGAFQLNIQELETLHRLQLPIKIFIWNNNGYASIRSMQRNTFNSHYVASSEDSGLSMPDISKIAKAYGIPAFFAKDNEDMKKLVPMVLETKGPVICELNISQDETVSPRVKTIKTEDGELISTPLEKMWPFLETGIIS